MKLNLPSTLTHHRAWGLFFLTLFNIQQVKAGNAFRNCLATENKDTTSYDKLLSYPFPAGELGATPHYALELCCDGSQCQPLSTSVCVSEFICVRLGGKIACNPGKPDVPARSKCQGIIGSEAITLNAVDRQDGSYCVNSPVSIVSTFTNNCLKTIKPVGLDKGYAHYDIDDCPTSAGGGLRNCNWDNQGLVCTSGYYCWIQLPFVWSGPADKNPTTYLYTPTIISTITQTISSLPIPTQGATNEIENDHLVEKIAIPVGSITGVSLTSILTYYFCKKKKRKAKLMLANNLPAATNDLETQEIELVKKEWLVLTEVNEQRSVDNSQQSVQQRVQLPVEQFSEFEQQSVRLGVEQLTTKVEVINPLATPTVQITKELAIVEELTPPFVAATPELITFTPPTSPVPQLVQKISAKQLHLNELKEKLIGSEDLWTNYLEVNQLLVNNPNSQFVLNGFHSLQNQLLQIFTISEIGLLIEDNHHYNNNQTEYTEFIEQSPVQSFNSHDNSPQSINYRNPQFRS